MTAWTAALFIGLLVIGLGHDRFSGHPTRSVLVLIIVVLGYEAAKTHAF